MPNISLRTEWKGDIALNLILCSTEKHIEDFNFWFNCFRIFLNVQSILVSRARLSLIIPLFLQFVLTVFVIVQQSDVSMLVQIFTKHFYICIQFYSYRIV